ncbi:hypothetical protein NL676_002085 [Syzygium grande]|nr:hypothetical protein NL676_002085 [Syzygium grande]
MLPLESNPSPGSEELQLDNNAGLINAAGLPIGTSRTMAQENEQPGNSSAVATETAPHLKLRPILRGGTSRSRSRGRSKTRSRSREASTGEKTGTSTIAPGQPLIKNTKGGALQTPALGSPLAQNLPLNPSAGTEQVSFSPVRPAEGVNRTESLHALDVNSGLSSTHVLSKSTQTGPQVSKAGPSTTRPGTSLRPRNSEVGSLPVEQAPSQTRSATNSVPDAIPEEETRLASVHVLSSPHGLSQHKLNAPITGNAGVSRTAPVRPLDTNTGEEAHLPSVLHPVLELPQNPVLDYMAVQITGPRAQNRPQSSFSEPARMDQYSELELFAEPDMVWLGPS